jgi:hypothetical protein
MKSFKTLAPLLCVLTFLINCASGITFNEYAPEIENYQPKLVLLLPTTVGVYPQAAEAINRALPKAIEQTDYYQAVVSPTMTLRKMETNPEIQAMIVDYVARLNKLGISDAEKLSAIGATFNVDSIVVVNLSDWSINELAGENIYRVAFDMKMLDVATNTLLWKAGGNLPRADTSIFNDPDLKEMAAELAATLAAEMPH